MKSSPVSSPPSAGVAIPYCCPDFALANRSHSLAHVSRLSLYPGILLSREGSKGGSRIPLSRGGGGGSQSFVHLRGVPSPPLPCQKGGGNTSDHKKKGEEYATRSTGRFFLAQNELKAFFKASNQIFLIGTCSDRKRKILKANQRFFSLSALSAGKKFGM